MLTAVVNDITETSHNTVLISSHDPHSKAPFMTARVLSAFHHQSERSSLNAS